VSSQTQTNVLRFIKSYIHRHGYGPTIREIAEGVGCAPSNAHRHVTKLAQAGKIRKRWHVARSIRLPDDVSRET
jgi:SOS-response transcriptional repressor LexA